MTSSGPRVEPHRGRLTIGLPVYNGALYLSRALDSLQAQDYPDFEIIISDNASTDATPRICAERAAADPRILVITQPENRGPLANFKAVVHRATGEYFMWATDDDVWLPGFASRLAAELDAHPEAVIAMCGTRRVYEDGKDLDVIRFIGQYDVNAQSSLKTALAIFGPYKHNLFVYGLYRLEFLRRAVDNLPRTIFWDRIFVLQCALAGRLRYADDILYVRTHRPSHDRAILAASRTLRTKLARIAALMRTLLRSSVVPVSRKALLPLFVFLYVTFLYRKELEKLYEFYRKKRDELCNSMLAAKVRLRRLLRYPSPNETRTTSKSG